VNLWNSEVGREYLIDRIETNDDELDAFLFSLGCYSGEPITVIAKRRGGLTVSIKDGRYHVDKDLSRAIFVK
jgi:ferrous iron transport protein A